MIGPLQRIAIVNRGETAVRLIRAVRELEAQHPAGRRSIALFTDADRDSLFVRQADESYDLGTASFVDERDGQRKNRYLDYAALERALRATRAEAAWVGWGFVAEHARFAELCRDLGVVFIGPGPEVMRKLGDKIGSKLLAEKAGVPVAPWSGGPVATLAAAEECGEQLGFPLMVKATAGGGGRGIRRVDTPSALAEAFESARAEALKAFGDDTVFLETLVEGARHVEVQVIADRHGTTWALGVRDCTIQRRNQKVLEETPSPGLDADQHRMLCASAQRLVALAGYRNAGTVEFLYDPIARAFSFMEVNARLQVEHPVTEEVTGEDLVKLQIHVAEGGHLVGPAPQMRGHAVEVRVNAEDPERGFAPAPGRIELFRAPGGPGVRVDAGIAEGDRVAGEFDSMIAKVIASGRSRDEALARLERALREMRLVVRGGSSNLGFLLGLLRRPEVRNGQVDNAWLDRLTERGEHLPRPDDQSALIFGAIEAYEEGLDRERAQFLAAASRGRPRCSAEVGRSIELRSRAQDYELRVFRLGSRSYRIDLEGHELHAEIEAVGRFEWRLYVLGGEHRVVSIGEGIERIIEVDGVPHRLSRDEAGIVRSPSPAVVLSISVAPGDEVRAGDPIAMLEAMKTELRVVAPCAGRVREIIATTLAQVAMGEPLVVLEPLRGGEDETPADRVVFEPEVAASGRDTPERGRRALDSLKQLLLGFDVDPSETRRLLDDWKRAADALPLDDSGLVSAEDAVLEAFADVCGVFRSWSQLGDGSSGSSEEHLHDFLRDLDGKGEGFQVEFLAQLDRALLHYGVSSRERSRELEEALLWICKADARMDERVHVVLHILDRRLDEPERLAAHSSENHRALLDRIIDATQAGHPAVGDLARELRYRTFDRPLFEAIQSEVYADADRHLATLAAGAPPEPIVAELVECSQPLVNALTARFAAADGALRERMLEVLTRRYYRIRELHDLETRNHRGRSVAIASYDHEGSSIRVFVVCAPWQERGEAVAGLTPLVDEVPEGCDVMLDLFLWQDGPHRDPDRVVEELRELAEGVEFSQRLRRLVVAVAAPGYGPGMSSMQHFTIRPTAGGGFQEERVYRGIHPMMAKRLQLWRTSNFEISRLPSTEDIYLFHGTARSNPKDERLFAFAEVRDLTPVRDAEGMVERLPYLEMMWMETLAAIRRFQSRRDTRQRLHWNRVLLYLWPPLELDADEIDLQVRRLAPATAQLGIEKVVVHARMRDPESGELRIRILQISGPGGRQSELLISEPGAEPIRPLSEYGKTLVRMRQRGLPYPYEVVRMLAPPRDGARTAFPPGAFVEHDLDEQGRLVPVDRPPGQNSANLVVGTVTNFTARHPEGMCRVILLGDPSREMGSFAEPECRRIIAALDLAADRSLPLEWIAISAGAKIAMDSGTENLDWTATALRRMVEFTQAGGEMNIIVAGVNVGGQSYWNAEATMLMHTRGILVMTAGSSMVLTGKQALDYSGGVSAEDNQGIGGYDRIMGGNGQAQYWASDLAEACQILLRYYDHTYVQPGERFPRAVPSRDPVDRDVRSYPHHGGGDSGFETVGAIFSNEHNPGRRRPFDIRSVMRAVIDEDHPPLERWRDMREAEIAVVWDAHLGGQPVCLLGFDSKPIRRLGLLPADGPEVWTAGTLFPLSSKKIARAINSASGNRPVVLVANLSGFDGSPESMRRLQLEYGAEIGRAVVNFRGPIVFCVISRYHGGAYVVFSRTLNENLEVAAMEGSYASVIGGAPAAAVVFAREVNRRTRTDPRLESLEAEIAAADEAERGRLRVRRHELESAVHAEKLGEVASEFEGIHSVERARRVGSIDEIISPERLRPYLVEAVQRGMRRELERWGAGEPASDDA